MSSVTLNGVTYTDDSNASTGMGNGGHRTRFVPCLADFLAEAATQIALAADQVDLAAAQASSAAAQASSAANSASAATINGAAQVALAAAQVALAEDQVDLAATQAGYAEASATAAASAATASAYEGEWSSLTGPLTPPASVIHNGLFWALSATLTDVTASEPGVDSRWFAMSGINPADTLFINFFLA